MTAPLAAEGSGLFVVVSGDQADRASAVARDLAPALGLPLLVRETLQSALIDVLDLTDGQTAEQLSQACSSALLAMAADCGGGVLEGIGPHEALNLSGQVIEVNCGGGGGGRGGGRGGGNVAGAGTDWPVVQVDTSVPVQVDPLADQVVAAAARAAAGPAAPEQWVVWRQDPFGRRVEVTRRDSQAVAQSVAGAMASTGQADTYLVTRAD